MAYCVSPGDYDDGEIGGLTIGKGKPKYSEKPFPSAALSTTKVHMLPGREASD
jgi:hypothetical protein